MRTDYDEVAVTLENIGRASGVYILDHRTDWRYVDPDGELTLAVARRGDPFVVELQDREGKVARFVIENENEAALPAEVEQGHLLDVEEATLHVEFLHNDPSECEGCAERQGEDFVARVTDRASIFEINKPARRPRCLWRTTYLTVSLVLEGVFQAVDWVRRKPMRVYLWLVAILVLVAPPVWLWAQPDQYTPVLETLLNAVLFGLALWLGHEHALQRGVAIANDRWLPQAESAMHRLLTVLSSVRSFRSELSDTCNIAAQQLPEIERQENRAIKTLFGTQCRHGAKRLGDIVNHLEDALVDWTRFVEANCQGVECSRII